ncbi:MAG: hypothetical protein V4747_07520 [Pseudomonadota bacterium]
MTDQNRSVHDRLCSALGIIQTRIMADDSALIPEKMFGTSFMPSSALEEAERIIRSCLEHVEGC